MNDFIKGLTRGRSVATRAKAAHVTRKAKPPGKFSVHAAGNLRFFDVIGKAQTFAEKFPTATVRRQYDDENDRTDVATWNGLVWSYIHRKPTKKKRR